MKTHSTSIKTYSSGHYFKCTCGESGHLQRNPQDADNDAQQHMIEVETPCMVTVVTNLYEARKNRAALERIDGTMKVEQMFDLLVADPSRVTIFSKQH